MASKNNPSKVSVMRFDDTVASSVKNVRPNISLILVVYCSSCIIALVKMRTIL